VPELPEVEVARRNLARWLTRQKLVRVELSPRVFVGRAGFAKKLCGHTMKDVERRGKQLRLDFDGDLQLFSHLGMTGKWVLRDPDDPPQRFERARLDSARRSVRYLDPRLLGRLRSSSEGEGAPPTWYALGPDPLLDGIDIVRLHNKLARRKKSIKETLLDQALLAGVGNIQAAEALWRARINPTRRADSLDVAEVKALAKGIHGSIADTLAREDGPEITYVEEPNADNPFDVYGKQGEPCPRCKTTLVRITQGGRSTVFCPRCQPSPRPPRRPRRPSR
jgi:formamidopyrimidine-DNA glycosylase